MQARLHIRDDPDRARPQVPSEDLALLSPTVAAMALLLPLACGAPAFRLAGRPRTIGVQVDDHPPGYGDFRGAADPPRPCEGRATAPRGGMSGDGGPRMTPSNCLTVCALGKEKGPNREPMGR